MNPLDKKVNESERAPYNTPQLQIYGDLQLITQGSKNAGHFDNLNKPEDDKRTGG